MILTEKFHCGEQKNQHLFNLSSALNTAEQQVVSFEKNLAFRRVPISCEILSVSVKRPIILYCDDPSHVHRLRSYKPITTKT